MNDLRFNLNDTDAFAMFDNLHVLPTFEWLFQIRRQSIAFVRRDLAPSLDHKRLCHWWRLLAELAGGCAV